MLLWRARPWWSYWRLGPCCGRVAAVPRRPGIHATAFEPIRKLPDGSIVELNSDAEIAVQFDAAARRVRLVRGEAHFRVEKDASRPFLVDAGTVEVRAVGTAFTVDLGPQAVEVVVAEGRVAVNREAPAGQGQPAGREAIAEVDAGKDLVVDLTAKVQASPQIVTMTDAQLKERLAWRIPKLEFGGMALGQAVELMNRQNRLQIVLGDPAISGLRISGTFSVRTTPKGLSTSLREHLICAPNIVARTRSC